jgi:hypothetical protein
MQDEPILGPEFDASWETPNRDLSVVDDIRDLVFEEPFAVLCTQGGGQPYGSVVAFAFADDLGSFVFATPVATRKYRLLSECDRVALVVDNRGKYTADVMKVGAVTVTGQAHRIDRGAEFDRWAAVLVGRHPYLKGFIESPSTALFRVDAFRFLHVTRFQKVRQWTPTADW